MKKSIKGSLNANMGETYHRVAPPQIEINLLKSSKPRPPKIEEEDMDSPVLDIPNH